MKLPTCDFVGNNNLYGLGIRLSIYIQTVISCVAFAFDKNSFQGLAFGNDVFRTAMLIGITYATALKTVTSVEAAIIIFIIYCIFFEIPESWWLKWYVPQRMSHDELRRFFQTSRWWRAVIQMTWIVVYSIWFWAYGVGKYLPPAHPECGPEIVWVIVPIRLEVDWLKKTMLVLCSIVAGLGLFMILAYMLPRRLSKYLDDSGDEPEFFYEMWMRQITEMATPWGMTQRVWLISRKMVGLAIKVLFIELTIRWNNVTDVNSLTEPDQLIPLFVSIGNFYLLWLEWNEGLQSEDDRCLVPLHEREERARAQTEAAEAAKAKQGSPSSVVDNRNISMGEVEPKVHESLLLSNYRDRDRERPRSRLGNMEHIKLRRDTQGDIV